MEFSVKDQLLEITIQEDFNFETAKDLLNSFRAHSSKGQVSKIRLHLKNVAACKTCAIGALLVVSEKLSGGIEINLDNCSADVNWVFGSGLLDKHFSNSKKVSVLLHQSNRAVSPPLRCISCFDNNCESPDQNCPKNISLFPAANSRHRSGTR